MNLNPSRSLCGLLITAGALVAGTAIAAEPEAGKVDSANSRVDWKGEVTGSWTTSRAVILSDIAGESGAVPCIAPMCDSFALEVGEKKDLTVGVTAPEPDDQVILRIENPAGEFVTTVANADAKGNVLVKFKGAATGKYTIDYWNFYVTGTTPYAGYAQLGAPAAASPAADTPPNQQQQAPQQGQTPQQQAGEEPERTQPAEAIKLSVRVGKASAKKLKRSKKLAVKVNVSRPASVSAVLKKGRRTIGKGKLAKVDRTGTLQLKIGKKAAKKLKKGKYVLTAVARDGQTSTSKKVKVNVRK